MSSTSGQIGDQEGRRVLDAALAKAAELGVPSSVAVVDSGGHLVAFARMSGAVFGGIEVSQGKAYAAAAMQMPTADLAPLVQPGQPLYGLEHSHARPLVLLAGGLPVAVGGTHAGAIGVSGGSLEQDAEVAAAGAGALEGAG